MGPPGGFKGVQIAMWVTLLLAIVFMIVAAAVPQWYVKSYRTYGLWKKCYIYTGGYSAKSICRAYSTSSLAASSLSSARGFSTLAIILALVGMLFAGAIELMTNKLSLLRVPRFFFGIAGGFTAISALSFVAWVHIEDDFYGNYSYGASFGLAWVAVFLSVAATAFAHLHHRALAFEAIQSIQAIQGQTPAKPV
ncbi:peripheral myelin protein 22-like [Sycon ciliatum]|uniref:peripheral myelin protein 22-like n=1 Tax=Sycon ciliatum TaxID=27933 RepID=UPI0020AAE0B8|eukprot:scpid100350/ scgid29961/ 